MGAFLDSLLHQEALTHFLGGKDRVVGMVEVKSSNEIIGSQEMHLLADKIAFSITAYTQRPEALMVHLQRFLNHPDHLAIQWVNLNHGRMELRTIRRTSAFRLRQNDRLRESCRITATLRFMILSQHDSVHICVSTSSD